jgi:cytochrome c peroxidase
VNGIGFTYNEVSRSISALDLPKQTVLQAQVPSAPLPAAGSPEALALRGQKFFNTGNARWSTASWVSCASCHPSATTDNVTWSFPAGPRQTVDTSTTFNADGSIQRILNWTGIFDEVHDFELNTRAVAGGVGAVVIDEAVDPASAIDFVGLGLVNDPDNAFNIGSVEAINNRDGVLADWDEIESYIASIRSPRGATVTAGDPAAGREIFVDGGCQNCHGGKLWTLSERYFTPVLDGDLRALSFEAAGIADLGAVRPDQTVIDDIGFGVAELLRNDTNGAPQRHLCVVREVGTFDASGPAGRGALELRQNGVNAQGVDGFNVPSLLNVGTGAPFLHHGAADTLEELLDPAGAFTTHLRSGNQVFTPDPTQTADLIAFLKTIDDTTPTIETPPNQILCPSGVVPPVL